MFKEKIILKKLDYNLTSFFIFKNIIQYKK